MEITKKGPPRYSLFHLDDDPGETKDLYSKEGGNLGHMKRALDDYEKEKARRRDNWATVMGGWNQGDSPEPLEMDDARREKLRALGYIQ